jgi:hypothetical protein
MAAFYPKLIQPNPNFFWPTAECLTSATRFVLKLGVQVSEALLHALDAFLGSIPVQLAAPTFIPMRHATRLQVA